jgi:hypothetical protein
MIIGQAQTIKVRDQWIDRKCLFQAIGPTRIKYPTASVLFSITWMTQIGLEKQESRIVLMYVDLSHQFLIMGAWRTDHFRAVPPVPFLHNVGWRPCRDPSSHEVA